jgi:hypothetical protein
MDNWEYSKYNDQMVGNATTFKYTWYWEWPPVWSSGQSSWLQTQRSGFDSWHYQIFWEVVGLERGPLSLMSTIEELLERKSSGSGVGNPDYGLRDLSHWPRGTLYPQKFALTSPTRGSPSVGIVRSWAQATEFFFSVLRPSITFNRQNFETLVKLADWSLFKCLLLVGV